MARWKLYLYGALALLGTAATTTYAFAVAGKAKTPYELAVLVFAASAAGVGWLGVVVAWLTYRLEAGKVPRPDVSIIDEGELVKRLGVSIDVSPPPDDFSDRIGAERQRLEAATPEATDPDKPRKQVAGIGELLAGLTIQPSQEDIDRYRGRIDDYLRELEQYLRESALYEAFWNRAVLVILAFTNHKAGAPAEGVHAVLRIRNDDGIRVIDPDDIPDKPEPPRAPEPPHPRPPFGGIDFRLPDYSSLLNRSLGALGGIEPRRKVSGPTIEHESSVTVRYEVTEILHNMHEDTRDEPILFFFEREGDWTMEYEIHARNLPRPRSGTLVIEAKSS